MIGSLKNWVESFLRTIWKISSPFVDGDVVDFVSYVLGSADSLCIYMKISPFGKKAGEPEPRSVLIHLNSKNLFRTVMNLAVTDVKLITPPSVSGRPGGLLADLS